VSPIRIVSLVCCAATIACGGERPGEGKILLRFHPAPGTSRQWAIEQRTTMKFEDGPMAQMGEQQMTMRMFVTQAVTGAADGGIAMAVTFDSTMIESPAIPAAQVAGPLRKMRGLKGEIVMDERMRVVRATFNAPPGAPPNAGEQLGSSIRGMSFPLPEGRVGVGDSWSELIELPLGELPGNPGPVRAATTFTVREIRAVGSDTIVVLDVSTVLPTDPIKVTIQGQVATFRLAGTLTGQQEFSVARSMQQGGDVGGVVKMTMSGAMPGAGEMIMSLDQRMTMRTVVTSP